MVTASHPGELIPLVKVFQLGTTIMFTFLSETSILALNCTYENLPFNHNGNGIVLISKIILVGLQFLGCLLAQVIKHFIQVGEASTFACVCIGNMSMPDYSFCPFNWPDA